MRYNQTIRFTSGFLEDYYVGEVGFFGGVYELVDAVAAAVYSLSVWDY